LDTVTNMLKYNEAKVVELEEVLLNQINASKEEAQQDMAQVKIKVTGKLALKGAKHKIWETIATTIFKNLSHFSLFQDEFEMITIIFKDIKRKTYELENKPELSNNIISFLNNRSKKELKYLNVIDRTNIVMDYKRVLATCRKGLGVR